MSTKELIEQTTRFLDVATYQKNPEDAQPIVESEEVINARISEAINSLDHMFGYTPTTELPSQVNTTLDKELNKFSQGKTVGHNGTVLYSGKANTGVTYYIEQRSPSDFTICFRRPKGANVDMETYSTFQAALYMLQSQVPSIIEIHNTESGTIGVTKDSVQPTDYASFDSLRESAISVGDTVQTIKQGQQTGVVEKIETKNGVTKVYHRHENGKLYVSPPSNLKVINKVDESVANAIKYILEQMRVDSMTQLDESVREEVLSIATDLAPHM